MTCQKLLSCFVLIGSLLISQLSLAQDRVITGKVTESNGSGVPGVNVTAKGSTTGTQTNSDGYYRLTVKADAKILVFSSVGYATSEVEITGKSAADVTLAFSAGTNLGEVVVTGYGTSKRRDLSTAVTKVTPKDFNRGVNQTADQLLQGKVAGLVITRAGNDPNGASNVQLRGPGSLLGGSAPFYVIDGVPGADINLIPPDDIASIDVLKDASATAIYGSRGANGVIVVTTKRGKSGQTSVTYNGYMGVENVSRRVEVLSAPELKSYLSSVGLSLNAADDDGVNTDWQNEIYRTGVSQNHNLSFMGGTSNAKYNASVNYFNGTGIMLTSGIQRITARLNTDYSLMDNKVRLSLSLSNTSISNNYVGIGGDLTSASNNAVFSALRFLPTLKVKNADGTYRRTPGRFNSFNPVSILEQRSDKRDGSVFLGIGKLDADLAKGLTYSLVGSMQKDVSTGSIYAEKTSPQGEATGGYARRYNNNGLQKLMETYFTYNHKFSDLDLNAVAGYGYQENQYDGFGANMVQLISDDLGANNLGLANIPNGYNGVDAGYKNSNKLISFFGRAKLGYKEKYYFEASVRRDGSSRLGKNNKWGNFPAVSAAWNLASEDFMAKQDIFSDLKLRVGYGASGENNISPYQSLSRFSNQGYGNFYYAGQFIAAIGPVQVANPDLKWQVTSVANVGIDWAILKGRISGSIDVYNKKSKDLLFNYDIPVERYGVGSIIANAGTIENKGFEFTVNAAVLKGKTLTYNTAANFALNKNNVTSLGNETYPARQPYTRTGYISGQGLSNEFSIILTEGQPIGLFYLYQFQGHDRFGNQYFTPGDGRNNGKILDNDLISGDDQKISGQALPKYTFGWNNSFSYKKFDLNFFLRGQGGNKILNATAMNMDRLGEAQATNVSKAALEILKTTAPGVPIAFQPRPSTKYLEDGSFVRMDNLTLGYTLTTSSKYIRNFRVYATCQNVFVLTKYTGIDPELNLGGLAPGIDGGIYPKTRTITFGVNLGL